MRTQNIVLTLAAMVTGIFVLAVGMVLLWPLFNSSPFQVRDHEVMVFNNDNGPFEEFEAIAPNRQGADERHVAPAELPNLRGAAVPAKDYALSGPHTHSNLSIFLIHGADTLKETKILTLQEALENNVATVHETGQGRLFIDNRGNAPLFIQSGDIVKGGTQDRVLPYDMLLSANTKRAPITALCVEQGRSFPRGNELSSSFQTATEQLPGRDLRLAAYRENQSEVWSNVRALQTNLARNAGGSVQAAQSQTSLQMSLEHQRVQDAVQDCLVNLAPTPAGKKDVIGYAVVVNGKIQSADVYASNSLFQKLWPKLIRASAVGALAERQPGAVINPPSTETVRAFLTDAERGEAFQVQGNTRSTVIRQQTAQHLLFDTCDPAKQNIVLHRTFLAR
ncbi:MAG: hypothetical protein EXR98_15655 [Gemmataceae bacterium]|nr:hypothetical protein [Gemmataceae bacterium]